MSEIVASKASLRLFHKLCGKDARVSQASLCSYAGLQLLVVNNTLLYRHLAATRVHSDDRAVEIGCSYGHCTALFRCPALGIDHAAEKIEEACAKYQHCRFQCGDVFGGDLSWLDRDATVLFMDIGGGCNYKPVVRSLAICLPLLQQLRLVVLKSIEVSTFLLRFEGSADVVARDLASTKDDDSEVAEALAMELRRRGGELPVSLIYTHLACGPRLRYMVGQHRLAAFLKRQAPLLELVEVSFGPEALKLRVRAAPGPVALPAPSPLFRQLAKQLRRQLRSGEEFSFLGVFGRVPRHFFRRYVAAAADPELHRQASDETLDPRCVEPWSDSWQSAVALRHLHAFLLSSPEFVVVGSTAGETATIEELYRLRVRWTGVPGDSATDADEAVEAGDGRRIVLQVLDSNWCSGEEDVPEMKDLSVERAWLLVGGRAVRQLQSGETAEADAN